jgi:O-antigen/teichoic acid export membrane protein
MSRPPIAILLAVVSALLIVFGRINKDASWGVWALVLGFVLLLVAAVLFWRANERRT